jgi:hypothetical protein
MKNVSADVELHALHKPLKELCWLHKRVFYTDTFIAIGQGSNLVKTSLIQVKEGALQKVPPK